ncbi:MAG: flagellar biosynthesis anti-sigma factor FlgM [Terriglobales bacterium]
MRIGLKIDLSEIAPDRTSVRLSAKSSTSIDNFSGDGASLSALTTQALQQPDVRQSKVDNLRQMIANGNYNVDPQKTADAMLAE